MLQKYTFKYKLETLTVNAQIHGILVHTRVISVAQTERALELEVGATAEDRVADDALVAGVADVEETLVAADADRLGERVVGSGGARDRRHQLEVAVEDFDAAVAAVADVQVLLAVVAEALGAAEQVVVVVGGGVLLEHFELRLGHDYC